MAEQFLSCDGNFVQIPSDHFKQPQSSRKEVTSMISIAAISSNLSTDDSSLIRRKASKSPKICCCLPVNAASIFGVTATCILTLSTYIYWMIRIMQTDDSTFRARNIGLLSVSASIILLFAILFVWGTFGVRHRLIVPFAALSIFLLFAIAGVCIFSIVTAANEWEYEVKKMDQSRSAIADLLLFRIILAFVAITQAFFVYCYIRTYLFTRYLHRIGQR